MNKNIKQYFIKFLNDNSDEVKFKEGRTKLLGLKKKKIFLVSDVLSVIFFSQNCPFSFEGMCLGIKKKSFLSPEVSFTLYGSVVGINICLILSYYCNRVYNLTFVHYKRDSDLVVRRSKLFFKLRRLGFS